MTRVSWKTNKHQTCKNRTGIIQIYFRQSSYIHIIQFTAIKSNQKQHNDKNNTAEGQPGQFRLEL